MTEWSFGGNSCAASGEGESCVEGGGKRLRSSSRKLNEALRDSAGSASASCGSNASKRPSEARSKLAKKGDCSGFLRMAELRPNCASVANPGAECECFATRRPRRDAERRLVLPAGKILSRTPVPVGH